jgi:hypothetical protein
MRFVLEVWGYGIIEQIEVGLRQGQLDTAASRMFFVYVHGRGLVRF